MPYQPEIVVTPTQQYPQVEFQRQGYPYRTWGQIPGAPYITVSSKGIVNGLSVLPNDGGDFGPDTTLGATAPGQYGSPYTKTMGVKETFGYAFSSKNNVGLVVAPGTNFWMPPTIKFVGGGYIISESINIEPDILTINSVNYTCGAVILEGDGDMKPYFLNNVTSGYMITITDTDSSGNIRIQNSNIQIGNMQMISNINVISYGHLQLINHNGNPLQSTNLNISNDCTHAPLDMENMTMYIVNYESYGTVSSTNPGSIFTGDLITFVMGNLGGETVAGSQLSFISCNINVAANNPWALNISGTSSDQNVVSVTFVSCVTYLPIQLGALNTSTGVVKMSFRGGALYNTSSATALFTAASGASPGITDLYIDVDYWHTSVTISGSNVSVYNVDFKGQSGDYSYTKQKIPFPTTPTVPASGTAQENTNKYPVRVYLYGGTLTEIQVTINGTAYTVFSNSTGVAFAGQFVVLDQTNSITITYTAAPTWIWLPVFSA